MFFRVLRRRRLVAQIRLGGNIVSYETACASPPAAQTVVMLHGAGQSSKCWENQISTLAGCTRFPSLALDLPGHGGSAGEAIDSMEDCARFVEDFCEAAGITSPIFIGHSMGGRIAQLIALGSAVRPLACVLVATGTRIRVSRWSLKTVRNDYRNFCRTAAQNSFSPHTPAHIREGFFKNLLKTPKESVYKDLLACDDFDVSEAIRRISVPTVIVAGSDDVLTPSKHTDFLHKSIKGSKLFVIEEAGHFMMMEKPDAFNKIMLDFLNLL